MIADKQKLGNSKGATEDSTVQGKFTLYRM